MGFPRELGSHLCHRVILRLFISQRVHLYFKNLFVRSLLILRVLTQYLMFTDYLSYIFLLCNFNFGNFIKKLLFLKKKFPSPTLPFGNQFYVNGSVSVLFCLLIYFVFYFPHISEIVSYLSVFV